MAVSFRDMSADAFERPARRSSMGGGLRADRSKAVGGPRPVRHPLVRNRGAAVGAAPAVESRRLLRAVHGSHQGNRRSHLRGEYGLMLRGMWWDVARAPPFEVFCADALSPAASPV